MKKIIVIALLLLSVSSQAQAFDEWTKTDTAIQGIYTVLHVIDWGQTATNAKRGWSNTTTVTPECTITRSHEEGNILLGKYPSETKVHIYFATTLIANAAISYILPRPYRSIWQGLGIGIELSVVNNNYSVGTKGFF